MVKPAQNKLGRFFYFNKKCIPRGTGMNVVVIGKEAVTKNIVEALAANGNKTICLDGTNDNPLSIIKRSRIDMAIVDSSLHKSKTICSTLLKRTNVPVMLLFEPVLPDWVEYGLYDVSGYIPLNISGGVLAARLKAAARRNKLYLHHNLQSSAAPVSKGQESEAGMVYYSQTPAEGTING
jgi:hypothetical protein